MSQNILSMRLLVFVLFAGFFSRSFAFQVGDEVEINSGAVTALSCALNGEKLSQLLLCPLKEVSSGLVVYDLLEKQIYFIGPKNVYLYELEKAFGGGRIDLIGKIVEVKDGYPVVEVMEYSITPKPKPGNFKGCL